MMAKHPLGREGAHSVEGLPAFQVPLRSKGLGSAVTLPPT